MRIDRPIITLMGALLFATAPIAADAQATGGNSTAGAGGLAGLLGGAGGGATGAGGLSGLMGGALPNVGSTGVGNAAGLLSYCVKNNLLESGSGATSALGALVGRKGLPASPGYAAGSNGTLVSGNGTGFSLNAVRGKVKTKICDMVLQHAKSML